MSTDDERNRLLDTINTAPTLSPQEALGNRAHGEELAEQDLAGLQKNQVPSNVAGAQNPDGFIKPSGNVLADEGFQVLRPVEDKSEKEEPILEEDKEDPYAYPKDPDVDPELPDWAKTNDSWTGVDGDTPRKQKHQREDLQNPADTEDSTTGELQGNIDWDTLRAGWIVAELKVEDFPDKIDMSGPEASIIAALTRREIELAGLSKLEMSVVSPDKDGKQYDVELRVDRIENPGAKKALTELSKKYGSDYLTNIWTKADSVDVYENREGQTMIMVRAKKERGIEPFFVLSTSDLSRILSVPSVKEGNSRIDIPPVDPKEKQDQYKLITIFANIKVNGQLIGGEDFQNFNFGRR